MGGGEGWEVGHVALLFVYGTFSVVLLDRE